MAAHTFWAVFCSSRRPSQIGPTAENNSAAIPPPIFFLPCTILSHFDYIHSSSYQNHHVQLTFRRLCVSSWFQNFLQGSIDICSHPQNIGNNSCSTILHIDTLLVDKSSYYTCYKRKSFGFHDQKAKYKDRKGSKIIFT